MILHEAHIADAETSERRDVQVKMLSDNRVDLRTQYTLASSAHSRKLIRKLMPKSKYLVQYVNLRFLLQHRIRLIDVHRVLRFEPSRCLALYIDNNSRLPADAKNDFEKEFFKLMNNAIYGKTCENQKKRT